MKVVAALISFPTRLLIAVPLVVLIAAAICVALLVPNQSRLT